MRYTEYLIPQSEPLPGQVPNSAGGYTWQISDWDRLHRFLVLGSERGTYYASEQKLTVENASAAQRCIAADRDRVLEQLRNQRTRVPKLAPSILTLAMANGFEMLPDIAWTGSQLLEFVATITQLRGEGRHLRRGIKAWYDQKDPNDLTYQVAKYRNRHGWTHRDVLRICHGKPPSKAHNAIYRWVTHGELSADCPDLLHRVEELKTGNVVDIIKNNKEITWEFLPNEALADPQVWSALLPNLPMTALLRNLGRLSANGAMDTDLVVERLNEYSGAIHPVTILAAHQVYGIGHGVRGHLSWDPDSNVIEALERMFYQSFGSIEPMNKRVMLALDVSRSMGVGEIAGIPGLTPRVASAAMAMVTARSEVASMFTAFSDGISALEISKDHSLPAVLSLVDHIRGGGTDCAMPMLWAREYGVAVDVFVIYTDNETWAGKLHPAQALDLYRQQTGIDAKMLVVGMTSTGFSIADPDRSDMMDIVGFDSAAPDLICAFGRGTI
jgi:60 kDa SS-A/Ro ribonucleoprotein